MKNLTLLLFSMSMKCSLRLRLDSRRNLNVNCLSLLKIKKIPLGFPIQTRVKSWTSLSGKFERRSLDFKSIKELHDLIGLRLIVLFRRDLSKVVKILDDNFKVLSREDTASRLNETQFGYQSIHYVVQIPDAWREVPTLKAYQGLKAEIQIRTVAQHIWAAASHVLQYKQETSVPPELRRAIHRASALLETVDLEFDRVVTENQQYAESVKLDDPDEELNVVTLKKFINDQLPAKNASTTDDDGLAGLLEDLRSIDMKTIGELKALVVKYLSKALELDSKVAKAINDANEDSDSLHFMDTNWTVGKVNRERAKNGIYFNRVGLIREVMWQAANKRFARKKSKTSAL